MLQEDEIYSDEDIVMTIAELTEVLKSCVFDDDCQNCPFKKRYHNKVYEKCFKAKNENGEDSNVWCDEIALMLAAEALERYVDKDLEVLL